MLVKEFLDFVRSAPEASMLFQYDPGKVVAGGFHVTEIKNTTYETIDCGNSLHTWNEVIVQLWVPEEAQPGDERMMGDKFMKIWDVVDSRIPLDLDDPVTYTREFGAKIPGARPSMLLDYLAGRRCEIDAINGAIPIAAAEEGLEAPANVVVASLVRTMERQRDA